jgi:hypothetical protein
MAPWSHMHFIPNKDVNPCCMSPIEKTIGSLENSTLKDVWNGEEMKQLRVNMILDRKSPEYCYRCYDKEKEGFGTLRQHMNQYYADNHWNVVKSTKYDGTVKELNLVHWDFRFSNICNQSCRTCGIEFSTQWHDDYIKIWNISKENAPPKVKKIWTNLEDFSKEFETLFDKVEYIHFAGGEPLITDEHYRILEKLIEKKRTNVKLRYSTNFSGLKYKDYDVVDMWKHFDNIELVASLDDYGSRYEYLRKGGEWNKILTNYKAVQDKGLFKSKKVRWLIHPTISVFNIFYLPEFHKTLLEEKLLDVSIDPENHFNYRFHLNNLIYPDYYSCQILPKHLKEQVTEKLSSYATECKELYNLNIAPLEGLISYMNSEDKTNLIPRFLDETNKLDSIRKEKTPDVFPFIRELFE